MKSMARVPVVLASVAVLAFAVGGSARTKVHEEPLDPAKGAKLASRIPCDGVTNPEDQVNLTPTFSEGKLEREFRINVYEENSCKRGDLGFKCLQPGKELWKEEWNVTSAQPENGLFGLASCAGQTVRGKGSATQGFLAPGSKDAPQIVLTGWYREAGSDPKRPWKQGEVKQVSGRWETYEFADPE